MRRISCLLAGATMALAAIGQTVADPLRIESPTSKATLLELYTSEGCSSCPPADRWLSALQDHPRLWHDLVPVSFHVDYWNNLGWRDRFSNASHSQRQRDYARHGLLRTVYTPGFLVNGREWRGWFSRPKLQIPAGESAGRLQAVFEQNQLQVQYAPAAPTTEPLTLHVVRLGFNLSTAVERGENRGRLLEHDFVVLGHTVQPLSLEGEAYRQETRLPPTAFDAPRQAIAMWVTREHDPRPLQAAGGWIE